MKRKMTVIDMHCDTLLESWRHPEQSFADGPTAVNLSLMREAGSLAQCFAMYIPWHGAELGPYEIMQQMYANYITKMEENRELIRPAYSAGDILKNAEEGYLSSFLTIEDAALIEGKIERIDECWEKGVRMIGLIWNYENCLAYPNSNDPQAHGKHLKEFGIDCVERMNKLGIIVDVSHLNEGGFYDVAKYSNKPFAATHSCARALCDHSRNLTDDQLKVIGEKGGIVGVNFYGAFLNQDGSAPTYKRIVEHLVYMGNKAGIDSIGFGSDFDGIDDNGELVNFGGFVRLLEEMQGSFTDDDIDKISHENVLRVMRDNIGE